MLLVEPRDPDRGGLALDLLSLPWAEPGIHPGYGPLKPPELDPEAWEHGAGGIAWDEATTPSPQASGVLVLSVSSPRVTPFCLPVSGE